MLQLDEILLDGYRKASASFVKLDSDLFVGL